MPISISKRVFQTACDCRPEYADRYYPYFQQFAAGFKILDNAQRTAAFCATIALESTKLTAVEEGLYYKDPLRIATLFQRAFDTDGNKKLVSQGDIDAATPYAKNPKGMSDKLYSGFHGRGLIQLTWKDNYEKYRDFSGVDVVANPDKLLEPEFAMHSAMWFWYTNKCNEAADTGSMTAVTRIVNGPALLHLAERTALYNQALPAIQMVNVQQKPGT